MFKALLSFSCCVSIIHYLLIELLLTGVNTMTYEDHLIYGLTKKEVTFIVLSLGQAAEPYKLLYQC